MLSRADVIVEVAKSHLNHQVYSIQFWTKSCHVAPPLWYHVSTCWVESKQSNTWDPTCFPRWITNHADWSQKTRVDLAWSKVKTLIKAFNEIMGVTRNGTTNFRKSWVSAQALVTPCDSAVCYLSLCIDMLGLPYTKYFKLN